MFSIKEIKVEYAVRPLGLDEKKPRFSWGMEADGQGVKQSACRIVVTKENGGCVWDSGRNVRADSVLIEYAGAPLEARTRYFVRVQADNNRGETASAETEFETGLMEEGLCGAFISHGEHTVPRFFKRFSAAKKVKISRFLKNFVRKALGA